MCDGRCAQARDGNGVAAVPAWPEAGVAGRIADELGWREAEQGEKQIPSDKVGTSGRFRSE